MGLLSLSLGFEQVGEGGHGGIVFVLYHTEVFVGLTLSQLRNTGQAL